MRPDYDKLYRFGENFALWAGAFRAGPIDEVESEYALFKGELRPRRAVRFGWRQGRRVRDIIWTTLPPLVLISKRFRDVLERAGLTGWSTYPVKVYDQEGRQVRGFFGLAVTGLAGAVDNSRSKRVWRGPWVEGGPKSQNYLGMFFKDDEWDGTDIFRPQKSSWIIVTERFKKALEEADLDVRNVKFDKLSTYERDIPGSTLDPPSDRISFDVRIAKSLDVREAGAHPIDVGRLVRAFNSFPPFREARLKWSSKDHWVRVTPWGGLLIHFFGHEPEIAASGRPRGTAYLCDVHINYTPETDLRLMLTLCVHLAEAVEATAWSGQLGESLNSATLDSAVRRLTSAGRRRVKRS